MSNLITISTDSYTDAEIISANAFFVQSMAGSELQYDTLDATLDMSAYLPLVLAPTDADALADSDGSLLSVYPWTRFLVHDPSAYAFGTAVLAYHDNKLLGKFYMQSCNRISKFLWSITAISPIGLLDRSMHYGGVYSSGETMETVLAGVIGNTIPYTLNPALANQRVRGWLPVASRRENLHQLLFAIGACVRKDENGDIYITYLEQLSASSVAEIPDSRIYTGGSVEYPDKATSVVVYEHAFIQTSTDETATLYEGDITGTEMTSPAGAALTGGLIVFDEPHYALSVTGSTILESGQNYAILSAGTGIILTGKPYTHTMRQVTRGAAGSGDAENLVTIEDATLVTLLNSDAVADRLYSYYHAANQVTMDIVVEDEKAGDGVSFSDPFDDDAAGYISEMSIDMSGILKAASHVVTGYTPTTGNKYNDVDVLTGSATWTVPADVTSVRVVLIGGGYAGGAGGSGSSGTRGTRNNYGRGGEGGAAGAAGAGGKILTIDLEVTPGDTLTFSIGAAGAATSVTYRGVTYSSANGQSSSSGYTDLINAKLFAMPGNPGYAGGKGNPGGTTLEINGTTYSPGTQGGSGSWEEAD